MNRTLTHIPAKYTAAAILWWITMAAWAEEPLVAPATETATPAPSAPTDSVPDGTALAAGLEDQLRDNLPPGGEYRDGRLIHTVQHGQSLGWLCQKYLYFTDYYTPDQLAQAIREQNHLTGAWLSPGKEIIIPGLRTIPLTAQTVPQNKDFPARGIYITMTSAATQRVLSLVKQMKPAGINTVVIDIKDMNGVVAYKSQVPLAQKINASEHGPIRDLPKLINLLHAQDIHVVARHVVFYDRQLAENEPRLTLKSKSGAPWKQHGKQVWADPANTEVQDYNLALAAEVASMGIDEIQFDYIRFPAEGELADIAYSFDPQSTPKYEVLADFLKRAGELLHPKGVLISVDVYGVMAWSKQRDIDVTGQRLATLSHYVDVISPMLYPSHFYPPFEGHMYPAWEPYFFVYEGMIKTSRLVTEGGARIRPWLQAFHYRVKDHYHPDYVTTQILASHDIGVSDFLLWNAGNDYDVGLKGLELWNQHEQLTGNEPVQTLSYIPSKQAAVPPN
ncbi:MAG TPA: putative glycoside hydrolase [Gammaproteobacteria bacterium]|nr:putative glycoside hydrolase [Gammaproteobacteria bacterium]